MAESLLIQKGLKDIFNPEKNSKQTKVTERKSFMLLGLLKFWQPALD